MNYRCLLNSNDRFGFRMFYFRVRELFSRKEYINPYNSVLEHRIFVTCIFCVHKYPLFRSFFMYRKAGQYTYFPISPRDLPKSIVLSLQSQYYCHAKTVYLPMAVFSCFLKNIEPNNASFREVKRQKRSVISSLFSEFRITVASQTSQISSNRQQEIW